MPKHAKQQKPEPKVGVFAFIRAHKVQYLIGAALALVLGFALAWFLGMKWSS